MVNKVLSISPSLSQVSALTKFDVERKQTKIQRAGPGPVDNQDSEAALCSLANSAYAPEIKKLLPHSITGAPSVGMGICEWGKVEFFNFGLPFLAIFSLKGPEQEGRR